MAQNSRQVNPRRILLFLFLLSLATTTASFPYSFLHSISQLKTLASLSHSLLLRVANLRLARGDVAGADRANLIAHKLENWLGLGFWRSAWSVGWDYTRNYAWRDFDYRELLDAGSDLNEFARLVAELSRADSEMERASLIAKNYGAVLRIAKSVLRRFVKVFSKSGAMKELVETVQREVVEGGLLRDCLELGSNDLKGLVQIASDLVSQFCSSKGHRTEL